MLPTLKEKKRYIAFELITDAEISFKECSKTLFSVAQELYGQVQLGRMGVWLLPERYGNNRGIIRVGHAYQDEVRMMLCFIQGRTGQSLAARSIVSSGILAKAAEAMENA